MPKIKSSNVSTTNHQYVIYVVVDGNGTGDTRLMLREVHVRKVVDLLRRHGIPMPFRCSYPDTEFHYSELARMLVGRDLDISEIMVFGGR